MRFRGVRLVRTLTLLAIILTASACNTVAFYDKGNLSDAVMLLEADATETHFRQKVTYSREGAVGGIGQSAGGGCGCY